MNGRDFALMGRIVVTAVLLHTVASRAQYNQRVPFQSCELAADTSQCFRASGDTLQVGSNVATLGELFRLCMQADTVVRGGDPIRVIIAIDRSGSMCQWHGDGDRNPPNDSTDQRIAAAHAFLDSLAIVAPESEAGIVWFTHSCSPEGVVDPLRVDNSDNMRRLHQEISDASCGSDPYEYMGKHLAATATYQGCALTTSFNSLMSDPTSTLKQHVILLTDAGWTVSSDSTPEAVLSAFRRDYPGKEYPAVHSVFMSSQGATSDPNLQTIADSTGGMFIPNATPEDIVQRFMDILAHIVVGRAEALFAVRFTHLGTGRQVEAILSKLDGPNDYLAYVVDWPLSFGLNQFQISRIYQAAGGTSITVRSDTLRVRRNETLVSGSPGAGFNVSCHPDSADIVINCAPTSVQTGTAVAVEARVQSDRADRFVPGDVQVRALTTYRNAVSGVLGLYHLDGALNDASGDADGSGTVSYASTGAAFGSCLSSGSFTVNTGNTGALSSFAIEAWVNPGVASPAGTIASGSGFELAIDAGGRLVFTSGGTSVVSYATLARNIWLHVAVVYSGGSAQLFLNGIPFSARTSMSGVSLGTVTFGPFGVGRLDELRLSTVDRTETQNGTRVLPIPVFSAVTWYLPSDTASGDAATLSPGPWADSPRGVVGFRFAGSAPGDVVVNFLHLDGSEIWSANGNPVDIYWSGTIDGVPVTAELLDADANGYIDRVRLLLPDSVTLTSQVPSASEVVSAVTLTRYDGEVITLNASGLGGSTERSLSVVLTEGGGAPVTGWRQAAVALGSTPLTADGRPLAVVQVVDRAGPVVVRALYHEGEPADTLRGVFSEPVVWPTLSSAMPSRVFVYYDSGQESTEAFATLGTGEIDSSDAGWGSIITMDNGFAVTPLEDSLQLLADGAQVEDSSGNRAPVDGRKAPIEWGGSGTVTVVVGPENPFVPGKNPFPTTVISFYGPIFPPAMRNNVTGTIVGISTDRPLKATGTDPQTGDPVFGDAVIYDAVANVVRDELHVKRARGYRDYGVYWDGRNSRDRWVGGGTYLMIVKMEDQEGKEITKRTKIGVLYRGR